MRLRNTSWRVATSHGTIATACRGRDILNLSARARLAFGSGMMDGEMGQAEGALVKLVQVVVRRHDIFEVGGLRVHPALALSTHIPPCLAVNFDALRLVVETRANFEQYRLTEGRLGDTWKRSYQRAKVMLCAE